MIREQMDFPNTWEEYEEQYGFNDSEEVYTNGVRLIPSFRVKQWFDHLEQDPCNDVISRQVAIDAVIDLCKHYTSTKSVNHPHMDFVIEALRDLPPVNPQQKTGHWVRWYEEVEHESWTEHIPRRKCSVCQSGIDSYISQFMNYCPNCGAKMVEPQESEEQE